MAPGLFSEKMHQYMAWQRTDKASVDQQVHTQLQLLNSCFKMNVFIY